MRKTTLLIPAAMIAFAAFPAAAQEVPRLLFCQGQCFGVAQNGYRIPITKGTELAPGLRLETGPNSYAQVRFGPDNACGIGENARVRFESRGGEHDVVILDQGRIRMVGGELIGRPVTKPVELRTTEGTIVLRSADIEVKTLPKGVDVPPMLVKLNVGDARIGGLPMTKDVVQGIVGGKVLDRVIPIGDIALPAPGEPVPAAPGTGVARPVSPPVFALPVVTQPVVELKPVVAPLLSPAIVAPTLIGFMQPTTKTSTLSGQLSTTSLAIAPVTTTTLAVTPVVTASTLILSDTRISGSAGATSVSLNDIAKTLQTGTTTTSTTTATTISPTNATLLLQQPIKLEAPELTPKTTFTLIRK